MLGKRLDTDKIVRTDCCALSAGTAKRRYDLSNAVYYLYGIMLTFVYTVAKTDTAEFTSSVSAVKALDSLT